VDRCTITPSAGCTLPVLTTRLRHSAFAPENLTTLAHLAISSAMRLSKSPAEPAIATPPRSVSLAFNLGSARQALISVFSLATIAAGGLLGAPTPNQALAS